MNPFYATAALSWLVLWAFPGFVLRTIPTNIPLALIALAVLLFAVARPISNSYAEKHPNLSEGMPRYKEILKGLGIIFLTCFFFQLIHYGITSG